MKYLNVTFFIGICFLFTELSAQSLAFVNTPSKTTYPPGVPEGAGVYGAFEGRTPCQEIAKVLGIQVSAECTKKKWLLVFNQDPVTHSPRSYKIEGVGDWSGEGKWTIIKGAKGKPDATVYQLDRPGQKNSMFLLKGDDNVLFVLDNNKELLVGGASFSYTLNRVKN